MTRGAADDPPVTFPTRLQEVLGLLAAFAGALWLRFGPRAALTDDLGTWIVDPDAALHLRRTLVLLARGFVPDWDSWSNFPAGHAPYFMPLLDYVGAGLCLALGVPTDDEGAVARTVALVPPLLGALTVVPVWAIARRLFGPAVALGAAFALALLPGHVNYTGYGRFDHHVLESLLAAAMVAVQTAGGVFDRRPWLRAVLLACGLTLHLLAWNGSALYFILFGGIAALAPWREREADAAREPWRAAGVFVLALPMLAAAVTRFWWWGQGEIRFDAPSAFHLELAAALAVACGATALIHRRIPGRFPDGPAWVPLRRAALAAVAGGLAAAALWVPAGAAIGGMPGFLTMSVNRFNVEGASILSMWTWSFPQYGSTSLLLPLLVFAVAARAEREGAPRTAVWVWGGWTLAAFLLSARMIRFTYLMAPFLAVLLPAASRVAAEWAAALRPGLARPLARRAVAVAVFAGLLAPGAWSSLKPQPRWAGARVPLGFFAALRDCTPEPGDWRHPEAPPAWGILAPWGLGNQLQLYARRPTVSDNIGVGFEREFRFRFETDEARALELLHDCRVRYVLVTEDPVSFPEEVLEFFGGPERQPFLVPEPSGGWRTTPEYDRRVVIRLLTGDGAGSPGLSHFRLITEFRAGEPATLQEAKMFEVVAGARLQGTLEAGATATATVPVAAPGGRRFAWSTSAVCDAAGRFELVVPYATADVTVPAQALAPCRVTGAGRVADVVVPEAAVLAGSPIPVVWGR